MLDCDSPLARGAGQAAVRAKPIVVPASRLRSGNGGALRRGQFGRVQMSAGDHARARVPLPAGRWTVSLQYTSPVGLELSAGGGPAVSAPPSLEGPGAYWRAGDVTSRGGVIDVDVEAKQAPFLAAFKTVQLGSLAFTRVGDHDRLVPLRGACGRYVDWYRAR
jgi:hypothetical protein